ncbi:MAG: hypothetical protein R3E68_22065 [Burkholderiaceae bacterium]
MQAGREASGAHPRELTGRVQQTSAKTVVPTGARSGQGGSRTFREEALRTLSSQAAGTQQRHCVVSRDRPARSAGGAPRPAARDEVIDLEVARDRRRVAQRATSWACSATAAQRRSSCATRRPTIRKPLAERIRQRLADAPIALAGGG